MRLEVTIPKSKHLHQVLTSSFIHSLTLYSGCISAVEAFDFDKQRWEIVAEMREGKRALNAVALPDGIYVLGGYNGKEYLSEVTK